jgi:hypothetical protein
VWLLPERAREWHGLQKHQLPVPIKLRLSAAGNVFGRTVLFSGWVWLSQAVEIFQPDYGNSPFTPSHPFTLNSDDTRGDLQTAGGLLGQKGLWLRGIHAGGLPLLSTCEAGSILFGL